MLHGDRPVEGDEITEVLSDLVALHTLSVSGDACGPRWRGASKCASDRARWGSCASTFPPSARRRASRSSG